MMPDWHQLDSSITMSKQQESAKKKTFKIKFQVILVFYQTNSFEFICTKKTFNVHKAIQLEFSVMPSSARQQNTI